MATAGNDDSIKLWELDSGREIRSLRGQAQVTGLALSTDGGRLALIGSEFLKLWDTATGKELATLWQDRVNGSGVAFSPDGKRLAAYGGDLLRIWDTDSNQEVFTLTGLTYTTARIFFSPDGQRLVVTGREPRGTTLRVLDAMRAVKH